MAGYLPNNDVQFGTWMDTFFAYLEPNVAKLGLTMADVDHVKDEHDTYDFDLNAHIAAQSAARTATAAKDISRGIVEENIRALVNRIQAAPGTSDADREALGITVRGREGFAEAGLNPADDRPLATIDISSRLKHVFKVQNQTAAGVKSGRPAGTLGAEIWRKVGTTPATAEELTLVGIATRSQYVIEYPLEDGGKQAHYMLRWVNAKGETGSWSDTESATIAA
jgi:hypothetical protein